MEYDFEMLCWDAGFTCHLSGNMQLDKPALCDFLCCSRRTLDRWLDPSLNNAPCPRAVAMIKMQANCIPQNWSALGARFTRQHELIFDHWRVALPLDDVQHLPEFMRRTHEQSNYLTMQRQYIDTLRNLDDHKALQRQLLDISEQLQQLAGARLINNPA